MANIFKQQKDVNEHPKRNNFDLSFQNHLTMKMGKLYPVFCKEVVPGDSFRINSAFGLKFMPLAFPVQSRMRANMQFFYVRNKNLWKDWENWIQGLKTENDGVVHPYIDQPDSFFETGKLADYLNIPTTLAVSGGAEITESCWRATNVYQDVNGSAYSFSSLDASIVNSVTNSGLVASVMDNIYLSTISQTINEHGSYQDILAPYGFGSGFGTIYGFTSRLLASNADINLVLGGSGATSISGNVTVVLLSRFIGDTDRDRFLLAAKRDVTNGVQNGVINLSLSSTFISKWNQLIGTGERENAFLICIEHSGADKPIPWYFPPSYYALFDSSSISRRDFVTPFSHNSDAIRVSALPFRAYESVVRCYYKNPTIQPLIVNGDIKYNQYNTTVDGGSDTTDYHLENRNYELDYLTSCLPSPQQGNAPLVGFNAITGTISIEDESGVTTASADVDNDGNIVGLNVTSPIASREHALTVAQIATAGMSINSFRDTNALQRWLETNIRKGYRYLDFIAGHFGKPPKYSELDMPEFIGGFSRDVNVSQLVSTADTLGTGGTGLGQFQGMANCFGGSNHSITHYCDDFGFIIGILTVVPTPAYSQLLPKHFLKYNPLDYYFKEFSQLGMQPITYEEVCPVQAYYQQQHGGDNSNIHDTFGYQRPNYDLVSNVDEIHGQFRGDLSNFLINRVFEQRPVLGDDFLKIDPIETNQIFVEQSIAPESDNIIGQVIFDVKAKRPVPRVVIPALGR